MAGGASGLVGVVGSQEVGGEPEDHSGHDDHAEDDPEEIHDHADRLAPLARCFLPMCGIYFEGRSRAGR
jgi:hypothetical protein